MALDEGALDMDLLAASLRADSSDVNAFVESLAAKLEEAVPDHTRVERRRAGLMRSAAPARTRACQPRAAPGRGASCRSWP